MQKSGLGISPLTSLDSVPLGCPVPTIQRIKPLAYWAYLRESPSLDIPPLSALSKMEKSCAEHGTQS
ncbi:uncharacterized protein LACBIDRAFT_312964 [Laccaria bicolor S238N-H82]|uniref:Predicted protein n=1 Tax=Laccaria bicolor (strain S238N-H82 / ATCC MYA-4686) TaxID=486041 RepID=B0DX78_LACBS|nr:uncharacterized protein LACBIDRAFT_312964 [Laccaria bicolor S238N-H82]EDR00745.1 predicted protein [Laccaria bicolor S238N-H82]|eukprot:XP_001888537.1 predicted protein [Laccaria bicolor S238N-H82]